MKNLKRFALLLTIPPVIVGIGIGEILSNAGKIPVDASKKLPSWPKEIVRTFAGLPVQQDGRVKPIETLANFTMLRFHGTRTLRLKYSDETKRTLSPSEWLLDCLFHPEAAKAYPIFIVDDPGAVTAVGVAAHESRRQRYSYNELAPAIPRLRELHDEYNKIKAERREPIQQMIVDLATNVVEFERLVKSLDWARNGVSPGADAPPPPSLADAVKDGRIPISRLVRAMREAGGTIPMEEVPPALREMMTNATSLPIYPHPEPNREEWVSCGHLIFGGLVVSSMQEPAEPILRDWEEVTALVDDRPAFAAKLDAIASDTHSRAAARGKDWQLKYESFYNKADFFYYALQAFVLAFLLQAVTWLKNPLAASTRWLHAGTWVCMGAGLVLVITGMVLRSIIMERWITSVITNLYETILFICAIMCLVGLAAEAVTRRKLALPITAVVAAATMFLSLKYEAREGSDTMSTLQAVLNTNYWLSVHVTTINMGYAGGLLGSMFSAVYLVARLFDPRRTDAEFFRTIARCTYGIVCFGLLFSLVGTILGGLWANDSWGRFWGWDPKENGALMIVLSLLIILHARLGGYIKEFGLHLLTLLSGIVVAFSWWHVNLLGVGLHSYGFTSGIKVAVFIYYLAVGVIFLIGVAAWILSRVLHAPSDPTPPEMPPSGRGPEAAETEPAPELAAARKAAA